MLPPAGLPQKSYVVRTRPSSAATGIPCWTNFRDSRCIRGRRRCSACYTALVPLKHPPPRSLERPASPKELFVTFTVLALQGFGGVLAIAQRVLCEQKRWLTPEQFVEILSVGQVLPGPNVCNVALMVGDRFFGWRGAFAALAGMMAVPLVIVLLVTILYAQYALHPAVAGALKGMGAVAAGLIIGTGLRLSSALRFNTLGLPMCAAIGATAF
jgi:chromate transporter